MSCFFAAFVVVAVVSSGAAVAKPRLGVVVIVDQMRPEYLDRSDLPNGGFRRLRREGMLFTDVRHLHIPTDTGPGHATLSTGRHPAVHGIVANAWYDRSAATETYCVADSVCGIGSEHLQGPVLADALKAADSRARVFAVSSKDRAAVLLGGRKADLVLWFDYFSGEYTTSSCYRRPAWLESFNAGLKKSGLLPVLGGRVPRDIIAGPATDEATDRLVAELIARERIGRGPGTDLLLISYSGTDLVGHRHGIEAPAMDAQLAALDLILGRLLKRLEAASSQFLVLALSSDHGTAPMNPSGRILRRLDGKKFGAALEKALQAQWPTRGPAPGPGGRNWILSNHIPHLYLNRALAASTGLGWAEFKRRAARALSGVDGVSRALSAEDAASLPASDPLAATFRSSLYPSRSGDIELIVAENTSIFGSAPGTSHGTPWDYDARVPLVFWGRGVRAGRVKTPAATVDLAPTLGRLLGLDYPLGEGGSVRTEVLGDLLEGR